MNALNTTSAKILKDFCANSYALGAPAARKLTPKELNDRVNEGFGQAYISTNEGLVPAIAGFTPGYQTCEAYREVFEALKEAGVKPFLTSKVDLRALVAKVKELTA